ncbi:hypothetical protein [Ruminococcus flavefaciens]|uniref:hypothetical protein n=1 Tax=Ruminococcus flavefaciens TaxID=1265 RepID=UPI0026EEDEF8|nr:hypothetical protein [Ruminococcus flavefaciens]
MAEKKNKNSLQSLIGFQTFTKYGVKTEKSEFIFYHVVPTNISVLPPEVIANKMHDLAMVLSVVPELEIMALDSCECFDDNKAYVRKRLAIERNQAVRDLLEADLEFLNEIQVGMSSAREFMFIYRFRKEKEEQVFSIINRISKAIADHGFAAHRLEKPEIKRMLGLYFGTSIIADEISDIEGEEYLKENADENN